MFVYRASQKEQKAMLSHNSIWPAFPITSGNICNERIYCDIVYSLTQIGMILILRTQMIFTLRSAVGM